MVGVLDEPAPLPESVKDLDTLRTLLWQKHGVSVGKDDPVMIVRTLHVLALDEHKRLIEQHGKTLTGQVDEAVKRCVVGMGQALETFKGEALSDVVKERVKAMNDSAELADQASKLFRRNLKTMWILTGINILALVFSLGVLAALVR